MEVPYFIKLLINLLYSIVLLKWNQIKRNGQH